MIWHMRCPNWLLLEYGKAIRCAAMVEAERRNIHRKLWQAAELEPRAIDREVSTAYAHDPYGLFLQTGSTGKIRLCAAGMSDGLGWFYVRDGIFRCACSARRKQWTRKQILGVMKEDQVNIIIHGHDPSLSEMICEYTQKTRR
ncbi:MAG: hypothetical protein ACLUL2_11875 [Blautia sp.]